MTKLVLATAIAITSLAVSGSAFGGYDSGYDPSQFERFGPAGGPVIVTGPWGCRDCGFSNGTPLTGVAIVGVSAGAVNAVILPSSETTE